MTKSIKGKTRGLLTLLCLAAGLAIGTTSRLAEAADTGLTTLNAVEYMQGTVLLQTANGVNYVGVLTAGAGCTTHNKTIDTLKSWQSLGQAALLSGKNVKIYFTACGGTNYISAVDIWN
jgi:hypothetical protein